MLPLSPARPDGCANVFFASFWCRQNVRQTQTIVKYLEWLIKLRRISCIVFRRLGTYWRGVRRANRAYAIHTTNAEIFNERDNADNESAHRESCSLEISARQRLLLATMWRISASSCHSAFTFTCLGFAHAMHVARRRCLGCTTYVVIAGTSSSSSLSSFSKTNSLVIRKETKNHFRMMLHVRHWLNAEDLVESTVVMLRRESKIMYSVGRYRIKYLYRNYRKHFSSRIASTREFSQKLL